MDAPGSATMADQLRELAHDDAVRCVVVTETREGVPHDTILEYAEEADVDVVVMGTHGRSGLDRYLLGSVTERVVRSAEVPVLTVRMEE